MATSVRKVEGPTQLQGYCNSRALVLVTLTMLWWGKWEQERPQAPLSLISVLHTLPPEDTLKLSAAAIIAFPLIFIPYSSFPARPGTHNKLNKCLLIGTKVFCTEGKYVEETDRQRQRAEGVPSKLRSKTGGSSEIPSSILVLICYYDRYSIHTVNLPVFF